MMPSLLKTLLKNKRRNYYPSNWNELRKKIYKRDHFACQKCGKKNTRLHVHHKVSLSSGGTNRMDNLTTLCKKCHMNHHPHMWVGYIKGIIILGIIGLFVLFIVGFYVFYFVKILIP